MRISVIGDMSFEGVSGHTVSMTIEDPCLDDLLVALESFIRACGFYVPNEEHLKFEEDECDKCAPPYEEVEHV